MIEEAAKISADMMALRPVPRISIQAFCESEGVANALDRAGDDRRMAKTHLMVHMGGIPAAMEFFQTAPTPNLLILKIARSAPRNLIDNWRICRRSAIRRPRWSSSATTTMWRCIAT